MLTGEEKKNGRHVSNLLVIVSLGPGSWPGKSFCHLLHLFLRIHAYATMVQVELRANDGGYGENGGDAVLLDAA